jgi:MoaA/NifB/PqqE/SkfB family radical SAM enzyme
VGDLALPEILPPVADERLSTRKFANLLVALRARRRRSASVHHRPFDATIDLTTTCQLKCPYCSVGNGTMERPVTLMREESYRRLLGDLGQDLFVVWYFSTGEPLLHKDLARLLATSKHLRIFSVISTNLSVPLSDDRLDALLGCGLGMISASIDGATEESYRRYRVGGKFGLVIDNVRRLVRRKRELGLDLPFVEWRFLRFFHNQHEEEDARRMARELGVDLLEFFPGSAPPDASEDQVRLATAPLVGPAISGPALERAARTPRGSLDDFLRSGRSAPPRTSPAQPVDKCDWHYLGAMVYPNGSVGPCCVSIDQRDDFTTLAEHSDFVAAWNSHRFARARESFVSGGRSDTVCDRCPLPAAQTYQFVQKLRAVLRVAPDWVLKVLDAAPGEFFSDADAELMPHEVGNLASGALGDWAGGLRASAFPGAAGRIRELDLPEEDGRRIAELAGA